ncbi:MAG: translocation/assembly module TamB domain-containing protein [Thiohalomonadales bacterium]
MNTIKFKLLWLAFLVFVISALLYAVNSDKILRRAISQITTSLPGTLEIAKIQGGILGPVLLQQIHFKSADNEIKIAQIKLEWHLLSLLYGNIHITSLELDDTNINFTDDNSTNFLESILKEQINFSVVLPVNLDSVIFRDIRIHDTTTNEVKLVNEIKFSGNIHSNNLFFENFSIFTADYSVDASGTLSSQPVLSIDGKVNWEVYKQGLKKVRAGAKLTGDIKLLNINLNMEQPDGLEFTGVLENINAESKWHGKLVMRKFDYVTYFDKVKFKPALVGLISGEGDLKGNRENAYVNGKFQLSLPDGDIESILDIKYLKQTFFINQATITQPESNANIQLQGKLSLANKTWDFTGQSTWQDIKLPLTGPTELFSQYGEVSGKISEQNYELLLKNTKIVYKDLYFKNVDATLTGDYSGMDITQLSGSFLDGNVTGTSKINWEKGFHWNSTLLGSHINPAGLTIKEHVMWPGDISFKLKNSGNIIENDINAQILLSNSHGELRGESFNASGELQINKDTNFITYFANELKLAVGDTTVDVSGKVGEKWDLNWDVDQAAIDMIDPGVTGKFSIIGSVTGERQQPVITGKLKASEIVINQQQQISNITVDMNIDLSGKNNSMFVAQAQNIQYQDYLLDNIKLSATGKPDNHQIKAIVKSGKDALQINIAGAVNDLENIEWQGKIVKGSLSSESAGNWQLSPSDGIKLSQNGIDFPESCWINNKARWCANSQWRKSKSLDTRFNFEDVPLSFFQILLNRQYKLNGDVNGSAELHALDRKINDIDISLKVSDASVDVVLDKETARLSSIQSGVFNYKQTSKDIISNIRFQFEDNEELTAEVNLISPQNNIPIKDWPITGYLKSNSRHPDFIRLFYTAIEDIQGDWNSDIQLQGTLNKPFLSGYSTITSSIISIPAAGLEFKDVKFDMKSDTYNNFKISGGFLSGDGSATIDGLFVTDPTQGWPLQVTIKGKDIQVFNAKKSFIEISPRIKLNRKGKRADISGDINVSRAIIKMTDALPHSINISDDVVFVNKKDSPEEKAKRKLSRLGIYSNIEFILSDQVYYEGYGISGNITGNIDVKMEPGQTALGQGALHIKQGRYEYLGVILDMNIGRLIFENVPISNPDINVRATKRSGDITAGVRLTGKLQSPVVSVYSIPSMPETEIVSYLLFGKLTNNNSFSLNSLTSPGSSDNALPSGSYFDYAIGLFTSASVLRIRFELDRNWELFTESSATNSLSGAEIRYTFER